MNINVMKFPFHIVVLSTAETQATLDSLPSDILFDHDDPRHTGLGKFITKQITTYWSG